MWIATVLAIGLLGGWHPHPWTKTHHYERGVWDMRVIYDRFSGQLSCKLKGPGVTLDRDTLIFSMGPDAQTANAQFRIDAGPLHSVREALALDAARGFFPDRGWIENPSEAEVALPASWAREARIVWIRANPAAIPRAFNVAGLDYMLRSAAGLGCPVSAI